MKPQTCRLHLCPRHWSRARTQDTQTAVTTSTARISRPKNICCVGASERIDWSIDFYLPGPVSLTDKLKAGRPVYNHIFFFFYVIHLNCPQSTGLFGYHGNDLKALC